MNFEKLNHLLAQTKLMLEHQKEKEILKGEKFNVFSILKMESKENATHSAFLNELLDPQGSHLKGTTFLKLFLKMVKQESLDLESCKVKVEHSIGKRDDIAKTGGRIDIFIWDKNGCTVSIENKIYAGDQYAQIERYCNFNSDKNTVYYLTLDGYEASKESGGELVAGKDYFTLSYKEDITKWLELCMKEAVEIPILRETIKQYILLINKLTHNMNNQDELFKLIIQNNEEASVIASNYKNAVWNVSRSIRDDVAELLTKRLDSRFKVMPHADVSKSVSQIWLKIRGKEENKLFMGIQSFSIEEDVLSESLIVGTHILNGIFREDYLMLGERLSDWWINVEPISDYNGCIVKPTNSHTLKRLGNEKEFRKGFVNHIVEATVKYVNENYQAVANFLEDTES
jgi:hypothetical protein